MLAALLLAALASPGVQQPPVRPDIVVLLLDDVGEYDIDHVPTPNLHAMAAAGVRFRRAYAHAWCAPTRDSLLRGTNLGLFRGDACGPDGDPADHGALTVARVLDGQGYRTAYLGKWHTGASDAGPWQTTVNFHGFDDGIAVFPVGESCEITGSALLRLDDGGESQSLGDTTIILRDALLAWWAAHAEEPRFALVSFLAAHSPYKIPPSSILPPGYQPPLNATNRDKFEAEIMGLDFVIGQILEAVGPETYVIVAGDNGTPMDAAAPGQTPARLKLTCYEGGVRVPLIVRGPGLAVGHESQALVHVGADLAPTISFGLLTVKPKLSFKGASFAAPLIGLPGPRETVFVWSPGRNDMAMIGCRWKLLTDPLGVEVLYDLQTDPAEASALPPTGPEADVLRAARDAVLAGG